MELVTYLLILLLCLVLSAFFSGSETALLRVRRHELDHDVKTGGGGPALPAIRELLESISRLLVTILLGNNVVNILGAAVASALAVHYLGTEWGIFFATAVMTIIIFVFCEVLPKAVAASHPRRVAEVVALPLYLMHQMLRPIHILYDRFLERLVRSVAGVSERPTASSAEEILLLARGVAHDNPNDKPLNIITAAARATDMTVSDIMVPRTEVVAFSLETPPAELLDQVLDEGYTRVPIYDDSIDSVLGVVHLKDLIGLVRENGTDVRRILKPVLRVPERKPILELLGDTQSAFVHLAVVKDEFGVTLGIVTQEDILEELVGEIRDEFDREELLTIRQVAPGRYQALGTVKVLDFNRETSWNVEAEPGDTLAGLVFNTLGRAPRRGESVHVPGYDVVVMDVSRNRVAQVQVIERPDETEQPSLH